MNTSEFQLILGNAAALDDDGWALIAPFGSHPKTRVARVNGVPTEQRFLQVLDNESADALLSKENSFFRRIKRAVVGIPVYLSHPDLADHAPETLGNTRAGKKVIGVVDQVRKSPAGVEAHFSLTPDGASAVENDGCKYPSALWLVLPNGQTSHGMMVVKPFKLISVGLTPRPNISGVESLANARDAETADTNPEPMNKLAGWLRAQGITLANDAPNENQVLDAVITLFTSKAGEVTALGNEKSTVAGKLATLETEKAGLAGKITTLENEKATGAARITALENSVKSERTSAATFVVDLAIHKGKLTVAERPAQITALENAADFDSASKALLEKSGKVVRLAGGGSAEDAKSLANDGTACDPRDEYATAVADHLKANPDDGPLKAHNAVKKKFPSLMEKLAARNADAGSAS